MRFAKNLTKLENWCRKNGLNIDRMKDDTYMYQVYTNVNDVLYIEQVMYKKSINFYCIYSSDGILKGDTEGNTQTELIEVLDCIINNKELKKSKPELQNKISELDFINKVESHIKTNLSNAIFDIYYDGNNYDELSNNINNYINKDTINKAIEESRSYVDYFCSEYGVINDLYYSEGNIIINNTKLNIKF